MSDLEDTLAWQMQVAGIPEPVRELRFAPPRRFRFDFCWPEQKVALEVEGGTWVHGAHGRGKHFERDAIKYNTAGLLGWTVFRVTTDMVTDGRALRLVQEALQ